MDNTIELPWGKSSLTLSLPPRWKVRGMLEPRPIAAAADVDAACTEALAAPIGAKPLGGRDLSKAKVVIVSDDHSRPTPVATFIATVVRELGKAGVSDDRMEVLLACGVHRASRPEEVRQKLGPEVAERLRHSCHDAYDKGRLVEAGVTSRGTRVWLNEKLAEADLVVCLGAVEPHLLLGFGGGLKMIVPGCAGNETIGKNHLQGVGPNDFDLVGRAAENSTMRQDLEEAALLLGDKYFIVNAVMNEQAQPARFFAGHPIEAHRQAVAFLQERVRLGVPERADVVITNSFPMDADFRQSVKCVGNTLFAAKTGGVMLGFLRCDDGLGEIPIPPKTLPYPILRTLVRSIGGKRILPLVERLKKNEPVEEVFIGHFGMQMLRRNHLFVYSESLPPDTGKRLGLFRQFTSVEQLLRQAQKQVPDAATVWVFPYGGATYAPETIESRAA